MARKATKTAAKAPRKAAGKAQGSKVARTTMAASGASRDRPQDDPGGTLSQRKEKAMQTAILEGTAAGLSPEEIRRNIRAASENVK
jgi:hypothetical protein